MTKIKNILKNLKLKKEHTANLENYYKHVTKCKKCGIKYGYDNNEDTGRCHLCTYQVVTDIRVKKMAKRKREKMKEKKRISLLSKF